jgi:hypothetical protein
MMRSTLEMDTPMGDLVAGSLLRGRACVPPAWRRPFTAVSLVFVWATEGKGDRDSGRRTVPLFDAGRASPPDDLPFEVRLPTDPWSYDGTLLKIRWVMRLELSEGTTQSSLEDVPFVLLSPYLAGPRGGYR